MPKQKRLLAAAAMAALVALLAEFKSYAAFIPWGVQENVPVSTVTGTWGWQVAYSGTYATFDVPISTVFAGIPAGSYVMYAARPVGAQNYTLLAAAPLSDVQTYTPWNTTTTANGAEWYYNGGSMGFAGLGDVISQGSADIKDSPNDGFAGINGNLRLSWHTSAFPGPFYNQSYALPPVEMEGGWRAGMNTSLNDSTVWERAVLFAPVPEPSTYIAGALLTLPFLSRGMRYLRTRNKTV